MSPTQTVQPWAVAQTNMTGYPVHSAQHLLRAHMSLPSTFVSGTYTAQTASKVKVFQGTQGLPQTGKVTGPTWSKLIVTISQGSTGPAVKALQEIIRAQQLATAGSSTFAVDGQFGPQTKAWVVGWQQFAYLNPDGIVGAKTWRSLLSGLPF